MMSEVQPPSENGSFQPLDATEANLNQPSCMKKIKHFLQNITVEPIIFFLMTPRLLCHLTNENLNLEKACYVNLGYNQTICQAMVLRNRSGYTEEQEVAVQKVVSSLLPYKQACHVIQLFTILLVSGWSDRTQKRKPMFYLPFVGDISALLGYMLCVHFFMDLGAEYSIFVEGILTIAFGGFQLLQAGSYSYVASITDDKSRTVRIGAVTIVSRASMALGTALSGYSFQCFGFYGVYMIALGMNLVGVVWAFNTIRNISGKDRERRENVEYSSCSQVWSGTYDSFAKCIKICFQQGPRKRRTKMIMLQLINFMAFGVMIAEFGVTYMFTRKKFGWDEVDYSFYKAYKTTMEVMGCTLGLAYFSKYLQLKDATIGMLSIGFRIAATIIFAFAQNGLTFYLGTLNDLVGAQALIAVRSLITKLVNKEEQTMANSMTSVVDSIGLFSIGPLYSFIYYNTVAFFPGAFFLFSTFVNIPIFVLFYIFYRMSNQQKS